MSENEGIINKIRKNIRLRLKDFIPDDPNAPDLRWEMKHNRYTIESSDIPIPGLVHFIFLGLLGFSIGDRGEKTHWIVPFKYKDIRCSLALEKLGLHLYIANDRSKVINHKEITGKLYRATLYLEKHLLIPLAKVQISNGNVTISNKYYQLDAMYRYFRNQAENAINLKMKIKKSSSIDNLSYNLNLIYKSEKEGFYNTFAMIDAYFSLLEHLFVLFLPFSEYNRTEDNLVKFIGSNWDKKFKRLFGLENGSKSKIFYDKLASIKEQFRNIFTHGCFEKEGGSLYFHFPIIGTIPARLISGSKECNFNFMTIEKDTFTNICTLFDKFEDWLENVRMVNAFMYVKSALNLPMDKNTLEEIKINSKNIENFKKWLKDKSIHLLMYNNVEY